jgi:hypothetical protein
MIILQWNVSDEVDGAIERDSQRVCWSRANLFLAATSISVDANKPESIAAQIDGVAAGRS